MSFDFRQLEQFRDNLEAMKKDAPKIIEELAVGEGVYAVKQARTICKNDKIVDTGQYRMNWHTGDRARPAETYGREHDGSKPRKSGKTYVIDIYNNADYAKHLEYGFRSHWVPAKYLGARFMAKYYAQATAKGVKFKEFPQGVYVGPPGGYVKGKFVLKRAIKRTEAGQQARLTRKWNAKVKEYTERGL